MEIIKNINKRYYFIIPVVLSLIVYAYSLSFDLINLDDHHLVNQLEKIEDFSVAFDQSFNKEYLSGAYFRPLVTLSVWADIQLGSGSFFYLHLTNVLLHSLTVIFLYFLISFICRSKNIALLSSSIYAVHPLFVNAVSWVAGRNDLLVGLFVVMSFYFFLRFYDNDKWYFLALHLLAFLFAAFSKETSVLLPVACAFYLIINNNKQLLTSKSILSIIGWIIVLLIWYLLRSNAIGGAGKEIIGLAHLIDNIRIIPELFAKFFVPADITVLPAFRSFNTWLGLIIIALLIVFTFFNKNYKNKLFVFGLVWFFIFSVPGMFSLIFTDQDFFSYFDCRAYLPSIGLLMAIASIINKHFGQNKKIYYIAAPVVVLLAIVSINESRYYSTPLKYWTKAVKEQPDKARYWFELGVNAGKAKKYESAERFILKAAELNPKRPEFYLSLGEFMKEQQKYEKAEEYFINSIERFPAWLPPKLKLAEVFFKQKKYQGAVNVIELIFKDNGVINELIPNLILSHISLTQYEMAYSKIEKYKNEISNTVGSDLLNMLGAKAYDKNESLAEKSWLLAVELNPKNKAAIKNLIMLYQLKNSNKAEEYRNRLSKLK
jgi:protein O-mannosyl-transferase